MTTKEYLQQIYNINRRINRLKQTREQLREEMYSVKSSAGAMSPDKVQSSISGDNMLRLIARVDELERDIISEMSRLMDQRQKLIKEIEAVPDERYRAVLFGRYVMCDTWEKVALRVPCDVRHVYRLHGDALQAFRKQHEIS